MTSKIAKSDMDIANKIVQGKELYVSYVQYCEMTRLKKKTVIIKVILESTSNYESLELNEGKQSLRVQCRWTTRIDRLGFQENDVEQIKNLEISQRSNGPLTYLRHHNMKTN